MPVMGMEAEFNVVLDGEEIDPRTYWGDPGAFIATPLLAREKSSYQIPTGGAVYFDRGVIEVVTPVIELEEGAPARVVRNLWEQIGFVRDQLTDWERRTGHDVRLKAYSAHYNISFELPESEQGPHRTIQELAYLLAYLLVFPVALVGGNRRSTGVGVRPRGNRIEITNDFTPDPGLMIATATLVLGIVRGTMDWPSWDVSLIDSLRLPVVADVEPGKHTTRKGWLTKDFHFPQSPFTCNIDARLWETRDGRRMSLRRIARETTLAFEPWIRRYADPFSWRLLKRILDGQSPTLLELPDRPAAYDDVGRLCRWGHVLPALRAHAAERRWEIVEDAPWTATSLEQFRAERERERALYVKARGREARRAAGGLRVAPPPKAAVAAPAPPPRSVERRNSPLRRMVERRRAAVVPRLSARLATPDVERRGARYADRSVEYRDRRVRPKVLERRRRDRRAMHVPIPFPDRRLTRSSYERVFLKLVSGEHLRIGGDTYTPVGMRGWYHAVLRRDSDGQERLLTVDQLLKKLGDWQR